MMAVTEGLSLSQKLHEALGNLIAQTEPGERLPSEPKLARDLGVSRATLREAMRTFETQGLISRRQGVGTFVLRPSNVLDTGLEVLESIETLAERIGLQVSLGSLEKVRREATEQEVEILGTQLGDRVIDISRVILAEDRPVAFLVDILPENVISMQDMGEGFSGSVLDLLLQRGTPPLRNSRCEIKAEAASSEVARSLNIQRGVSLLCFNSVLFADDGSAIDYSMSYFLPGYFRFHVLREVA